MRRNQLPEPTNSQDRELEWLEAQIKTDHLQGALASRCGVVEGLLKNAELRQQLPQTVALFGSWGSGKTTILAQLFKDLKTDHTIIYFNAYKHAAFMEIMPALVYRLIQAAPSEAQHSKDIALAVVCSLVTQNARSLGELTKKNVGIDPYQIYETLKKGLESYVSAVNGTPSAKDGDKRRKLLENHYTQVDSAQNALTDCFALYKKQNPDKAIVVLVDELDRCDPGEAFDVMKQLRVLFSMRNLPFFFVLAANPDPIGQAIQHKYGLDKDDYESRRILEKFVDTCVDLNDAVRLRIFIEKNWERALPNRSLSDCSTLIGLDSKVNHLAPPEKTTTRVLHTLLNDLDNAHFLYSNLRLLSKSINLTATYTDTNTQLWTTWHLILARQLRPVFRREIAQATEALKIAAERGYLKAFRRFADNGLISEDGRILVSPTEGFQNGHPAAPFKAFYSEFWDSLKSERVRLSSQEDQANIATILESFLIDVPKMEFLANMSAFSLGKLEDLRVNSLHGNTLDDLFYEGYNSQRMRDFGWLLANF